MTSIIKFALLLLLASLLQGTNSIDATYAYQAANNRPFYPQHFFTPLLHHNGFIGVVYSRSQNNPEQMPNDAVVGKDSDAAAVRL